MGNNTDFLSEYNQYIQQRTNFWLECGNDEWPNAIEPKSESIAWLADNRAREEANAKFGMVRISVGIDAEGRYL